MARTARTRSATSRRAIVIRTPSGGRIALPSGAAASARLQEAAQRWTYVLRNRARWSSLPKSARNQYERVRAEMRGFGVTPRQLHEIAGAGMVEVSIPYVRESVGWEARIFPWEFALANATREERLGRPLAVVRHLAGAWRPRPPRAPMKVLFVMSAPGKLRDQYSFDTERAVVQAGLKPARWEELRSPTLAELRRRVAAFKPDVIHLAGFDSHQGLLLLGQTAGDGAENGEAAHDVKDGYLLASRDGARGRKTSHPEDAVPAHDLAAALCPRGHRPQFVFCSMYNSAARIAPALVARGVQASIGFQDAFDDMLAELFIGAFYRAWRKSGWNLAEGFRRAWDTLRAQPRPLKGSGLVLWSGTPLPIAPSRAADASDAAPPTVWYPDTSGRDAADVVGTDIRPLTELNYALLHNRQEIFERFSILNTSAPHNEDAVATLRDLDVAVTLSAGAEEARYQTRLALAAPTRDLRGDVHLPLTSDLLRSVNEAINTSLLVEVSWGKVLYRQSHAVRLMPVDQWRDNDRDGQWLPSFVLPRDPAVASIVDRAKRVVRIIRDDPTAGFEGYQSDEDTVDQQVRALWATILFELDLGYVNPPPSYSSAMDAQRLRTPSTIVRDRAGTCLDLALFFAACCELIGVYPVVFLRDDHAFPGYWRSDGHQQRFMEVQTDPPTDTENREGTQVPGAQRYDFWLRKLVYGEIAREVREQRLVALESVALTEHKGFTTARQEGRDRLFERRGFHSMLDIARARDNGVTPLPIGTRG